MNGLEKKLKKRAAAQFERPMQSALAEFEMDSRLACRALKVSIAMNGFGVGSVLPNDLPGPHLLAAPTAPFGSHAVH